MENNAEQKAYPINDPSDCDDYEDDDIQEEPDYYLCYCCGHSTTINHGGWGCPRCTAIMSPEYY